MKEESKTRTRITLIRHITDIAEFRQWWALLQQRDPGWVAGCEIEDFGVLHEGYTLTGQEEYELDVYYPLDPAWIDPAQVANLKILDTLGEIEHGCFPELPLELTDSADRVLQVLGDYCETLEEFTVQLDVELVPDE